MRTLFYGLIPAICLLTPGCSAPLFDLVKLKDKETPLFAGKAESYQPAVQALAFSPDGKYLASCHQYMGRPDARSEVLPVLPVVKIWQMDSCSSCFDLAAFHIQSDLMGTDNTAFCFTPDGKKLSVLSKSGLLFWDIEQLALQRSTVSNPIAVAHDAKTVAIETNRDGSPVTGDNGGDSISIVSSETGESLQRISPNHLEACPWCFSPDGRRLLVQCYGQSSKHESWEIWDLPEGRLRCSLPADKVSKWPSSFSPDGKTLAMVVITGDKTKATLWDAASGRQEATLWQDIENLRCLAFSPDGRWLAVGCGHTEQVKGSNEGNLHGQLLLWDLKREKEYASVIDRSSWGITALAFAPDGKTIATGDGDGNIRFWEIDRLKNASVP